MSDADTLEQRRLLSRRTYVLVAGGVEVEEKDLLGGRTYRVPYENIGPELFEISTSSRGWFWASLVAFALGAVMLADLLFGADPEPSATLFYAAFGVVFLVVHLASRTSFVGFPAGNSALLFWKDRPSAWDLMSFVERMQAQQQAYLRQTYVQQPAGRASVADELERLAALKERGVLTDDEFERLKADVVGSHSRGFIGLN